MMLIKGMAYYVDMKGNGTSLLLLHGFTGSSQNWASQLDFFRNSF